MTGAPDTEDTVDVIVVEDHELLAQSLIYALEAEGLRAVASPGLDPDTILATVRSARAPLVLLDLDLGSYGPSIALIGPCRTTGARVLILTASTDRLQLATCIEAGAVGVVGKSLPLDELVAAIRQVADAGTLITAAERQEWLAELRYLRAQADRRWAPFDQLTEREAQVLQALIEGRSAERIAADGVVAVSTVRSQIRAILTKLGVNSQLAAVALAHESGWSADPGPS